VKRYVVERTLRSKTILEWHKVLSTRIVEIGPVLIRDAVENEPADPAPDPSAMSRAQIGYWKRLVEAVRTWGPR
jgi:hypothetical protein